MFYHLRVKTSIWILFGFLAHLEYGRVDSYVFKNKYFDNNAFLTELINRIDKHNRVHNNYFQIDDELPMGLAMVSRSAKPNLSEDYDVRSIFMNNMPSLRDQEYLRHSSLWANQYLYDGADEMSHKFAPLLKSEASLPAYCNPPNPCPYGYENNQDCISDFENTAFFSREYQAAQDCTCDSEHMFDCALPQGSDTVNNKMAATIEKFLLHNFQNNNDLENLNPSNDIVKKYYSLDNNNPFWQGDKLPIAAKKGFHIKN